MSNVDKLVDLLPHVVAILVLLSLAWFTWKAFRPRDFHSLRSVAVLVLGDIDRSPRMMYHAQSFAENGFSTDLVGYGGSNLIPSLERLPRVKRHYLPEPPMFLRYLPFIIAAPIKIIHQIVSIMLVLMVRIEKPPEFIIVQNPPSIPTLALVQLVGRIRGSKIIIDWHNLGYSILALKLGQNHIFVRISKWFEETFGYSAYAHLFVTRAMRDFLVKEWDIQGHKVVLYDRPPRHFHHASAQEIHELFRKIQPLISSQRGLQNFLPKYSAPYSTPFTITSSKRSSLSPERPLGTYSRQTHRASISSITDSAEVDAVPAYTEIRSPTLRPDRPALLVSSTSWTPDEDFSILLGALGLYELRARELAALLGTETLPKLLTIVTGKGPLKEKYMQEVGRLQESWVWVRCISLWLEAEDYPVLLGAADLGVSLHSSSSALDLPMKVVDMFGCGLPVCALNFACLHELVKDGENGLVFNNAVELAEQLETLFTQFPDAPKLRTLASSLSNIAHRSSTPTNPHVLKHAPSKAEEWTWTTWEENWGCVIRPLILNDVNL